MIVFTSQKKKKKSSIYCFMTISFIPEDIPTITLLKERGCSFPDVHFSFRLYFGVLTHQRVLRVAAAADRTVGFPLFSYLLSFLQCGRYGKNALVESKIEICSTYIIIKKNLRCFCGVIGLNNIILL